MKILIENCKDGLVFSLYKKTVPQEDLNNTNIISSSKMIFDEDYIVNNCELLSSFLKTIVLKYNLNGVYINQNSIAIIVLKVISNIESIDSVYFKEDKVVSYDIGCQLVNCHYVNYLNCFSMPHFLFDKLNLMNNIKIDLRSETIYQSDFMNSNNLFTYSQIYYKKLITINNDITNDDLEDLDAFLQLNNKLKIIEVRFYSVSIMKVLFELLSKNNILKVKVIIVQKGNDISVLNRCVDFIKTDYNKLIKKQRISIKIKHSDSYKKKVALKQINLSLVRIIFIGILLLSLIIFLIVKMEERKAQKKVDEIADILKKEVIEDVPPIDVIEVESPKEEEKKEVINPYYVKYDKVLSKLLAINSDTVGWLTVNNTGIDYPVVKQKDNSYYLYHNFYKESNGMGWIFLDYRINVKDLNDNNIIYGHDSNSDLMFGSLKKVLNESWYKNPENQFITFNTVYKNMSWQIFSIYTIKVTNDYLISTFSSRENYEYFLEREKNRSIYNFDVELNRDDKILTLSTCYKDSNHRLVVHAKLIK